MVKHTQTIRRLLPTNCLSVFDHFVGLALKGLIQQTITQYNDTLDEIRVITCWVKKKEKKNDQY